MGENLILSRPGIIPCCLKPSADFEAAGEAFVASAAAFSGEGNHQAELATH